ncbi:hypothetical protein BC628DRAFT_131418 [Trametes gibbosa]|nr:hypothetical protein BC628DRAFT_131418 [Trametes gibbosa]
MWSTMMPWTITAGTTISLVPISAASYNMSSPWSASRPRSYASTKIRRLPTGIKCSTTYAASRTTVDGRTAPMRYAPSPYPMPSCGCHSCCREWSRECLKSCPRRARCCSRTTIRVLQGWTRATHLSEVRQLECIAHTDNAQVLPAWPSRRLVRDSVVFKSLYGCVAVEVPNGLHYFLIVSATGFEQ